MTREIAHSTLNTTGSLNVARVIDAIYTNLEERTCSNCKHYLQHQCQNSVVDAMLDPAKEMRDNVKVEPDFGCNKWQLRTKPWIS